MTGSSPPLVTRTGTSSAGWAGWTSSAMRQNTSSSFAFAVKAVSVSAPAVSPPALSTAVLPTARTVTVTPRQRSEYR